MCGIRPARWRRLSRGEGDWALYDVCIPHDGKLFRMTVQAVAFHNRAEIPRDVIEHMIDSIDLKSG